MILAMVGTVQMDFGRMVEMVMEVFGNQKEEVLLQYGYTDISKLTFPKHFSLVQFIDTKDVRDYVLKASLIVISGGEATALEVVKNASLTPIIFPRLRKFGEHVDDQQLEIAKYFSENSLGRLALDVDEMRNNIGLIKAITKAQKEHLLKSDLNIIVKNLHKLSSK